MARRKLNDLTTRQLFKTGNGSYSVTLPISFIRELGWEKHQKVVIKKHGKKLTIEDWKK